MTKTLPFLILICFFFSCSPKFKPLFNGTNLNGWYAYTATEKKPENAQDIYPVSDHMIRFHGEKVGYLMSNKSYKNFILTLKFKQEANGNSGVFFRSSIDGVKISGWQVEVAPLNHHTGGIYESYGRGWLIQPNPLHERFLKEGQWNTLKIKYLL